MYSLEKIYLLVIESSYIQDYELENRIKATKKVKNLDCPEGTAVLDWWESSQRFKRCIIFSAIFTYLSPPVTLKMRSRLPKSNQLFRIS